ncbi:ATP-binding protein [Kitasatospora sp. NPDC096147]|uniref:ATP-binding protein n=1 Tax=Kitasatospora sp. NPDC096147 TaxID=3364093 RepID=UPI0037FF9A93
MASDPTASSRQTGTPSVRPVEVDLKGVSQPVTVARRRVHGALAVPAVPELVREDAVLVTAELVANAALHAGGPGVLRLTVLDDGALRIEVDDAGPGLPRRRPPSPGRPGGHGLQVVQLLSRSWGTRTRPGGKTVWAEIPATAAEGAWQVDSAGRLPGKSGESGGGAAGRP